MNTDNQERIIAAVVMDAVGINVSPHNLLLIAFKVFLEVNGHILLNLVTFKPLASQVCIHNSYFISESMLAWILNCV